MSLFMLPRLHLLRNSLLLVNILLSRHQRLPKRHKTIAKCSSHLFSGQRNG